MPPGETASAVDPVALTRRLIRCPSVTPDEAGTLAVIEDILAPAGFECHRVARGDTVNLFARLGPRGAPRTLGFNGHVDVVPPGDAAAWTHDPFGAVIDGDLLYGRGAADMKSGVAAFAAAAADFARDLPADDAIIITIAGDEEGGARDGTRAILDWMAERDERMTHCLVGEPTCPQTMGEMMKIGRRGSLTCRFHATGVQGHAAYPQRARNPLSALVMLLARLGESPLDEGTAHFGASTLVITTIDCGNPAGNVIPAEGRATINIRFNDRHSGKSLRHWLRDQAAVVSKRTEVAITTEVEVSGESFLTEPGPFSALVRAAVQAETGITPDYSTSGGTSDARFIKDHCPVVEFGLVGNTMHQVDERVEIPHVHALKAIYSRVLQSYFA